MWLVLLSVNTTGDRVVQYCRKTVVLLLKSLGPMIGKLHGQKKIKNPGGNPHAIIASAA
jgi:hypothetical protein